jgi:hypothetical protein
MRHTLSRLRIAVLIRHYTRIGGDPRYFRVPASYTRDMQGLYISVSDHIMRMHDIELAFCGKTSQLWEF